MSDEKEEPSESETKSILENPRLELIVSLLLVIGAASEAYESFDGSLKSLSLRSHHGIIIFGLFQTLKALAEVIEHSKKLKK